VKIETLEELNACPPGTRAVFPFQGDILPLIQQGVAELDLCDAAPGGVRAHYERCRKLFVRGYFDYELFTVAGEYSVISVEMVLRERLELKLPDKIPWLYKRACLHLIGKAVKEKLVVDPERRYDLEVIRKFRNEVLHGKETMLVTPGMVQPVIRMVAAVISHVWRQ
jgi:hypothetical protein